MRITEKVFNFRDQSSRSRVYKCKNAASTETYTSTVWRRGSIVSDSFGILLLILRNLLNI